MVERTATVTTVLSDWAAAQTVSELPSAVMTGTSERILDAIGVGLAGASTPFARRLAAALCVHEAPNPGATAFLAAALTTCLDFDDTHDSTLIHPTGPAVCAALAIAASKPVSGAQFVAATALGVEIACRIALAAPGAFHARGLHPTGMLTVFGSAAAAAWLMEPRAAVLRHALGVAGSFSSGLMQPFIDGSDQRYLHSGNAAAAGWLAARAAAAGLEGSDAAVEGRFGLFATHVPDAAPFDLAAVTAGLGSAWACQSVLLKRYPTGYVTHPYIDAALTLADEPDFHAGAIDRLTCVVPSKAVALVCEPRVEKLAPRNATLARISLPHMLAEAMIFGAVDAKAFSPERLTDPRVQRLAARIEYAVSQTQGDERLVVETRATARRVIPIRPRPMTRTDVVEKFVANAEPVFGATEARSLADEILMLASQPQAGKTLDRILRAIVDQTR